jgi:hypothetical protein
VLGVCLNTQASPLRGSKLTARERYEGHVMNYSRLIGVKKVVSVGHERLTMWETRIGEMNFLSSFVLFLLLRLSFCPISLCL